MVEGCKSVFRGPGLLASLSPLLCLNSLLAEVEERAGDYVASAREYELAAHMKPSEDNLFAWGCELLRHAAYQPTGDVFAAGSEPYPLSARMEVGTGIALYARDIYNKLYR